MSKAYDISMWLNSLVGNISIANGYATDIGASMYRGRTTVNADELPCAVLVEGEDIVKDERGTRVKLGQRYIVEGHDVCDPLQPNDKAHLIIADLKRALFTANRGVGGSMLDGKVKEMRYIGRSIGSRPDGAALIAASVEIEIEYEEDLANP